MSTGACARFQRSRRTEKTQLSRSLFSPTRVDRTAAGPAGELASRPRALVQRRSSSTIATAASTAALGDALGERPLETRASSFSPAGAPGCCRGRAARSGACAWESEERSARAWSGVSSVPGCASLWENWERSVRRWAWGT